jgi:hypothetical protein
VPGTNAGCFESRSEKKKIAIVMAISPIVARAVTAQRRGNNASRDGSHAGLVTIPFGRTGLMTGDAIFDVAKAFINVVSSWRANAGSGRCLLWSARTWAIASV